MPSVKVQYKDAGALRFLKLLSGFFGFKVLEKNAAPLELKFPHNALEDQADHSRIPANESRNYEDFLTSKNFDAATLRRDTWKRD